MSAQVIGSLDTDSDYGNEYSWGCFCTSNKSKSNCLKLFEPMEAVLSELFRETSILGFQYVGQKGRHTVQRAFWICIILGVTLFSAYLIRIGVVEPLLGNPIVITFHSSEVTVNQILFPAFSICSNSLAKKTEIEKLQRFVNEMGYRNVCNPDILCYRVLIEYLDYVESNRTAEYLEKFGRVPSVGVEVLKTSSSICTQLQLFSKMSGFVGNTDYLAEIMNHGAAMILNSSDHGSNNHVGSLKHFREFVVQGLVKIIPSCSDLILRCMWRNKKVSCQELFTPIETNPGACCTFNMVPEIVMRENSKNLRVSSFDRRLNDSVVEAWRSWDIDKNLLNPSADSGNKLEYPLRQLKAGVRNGLSILVNPMLSEYSCARGNGRGFRVQVHSPLSFHQMQSFGSGVGPNEEVFMGVAAQITTADPKEIKSYSFKKRQCYFLGEKKLKAFKFYRKENCIHECIAEETWARCGCIRIIQPNTGNRTYCVSNRMFSCVLKNEDDMRRTGIQHKCKACLPSCTQLDYTSGVSKMPMRDDVGLWKKDSNGVDEIWANESVSIIHVFFTSDFVETRVRKSLSGGFKKIVADTGGLLGFSIGFSLITLAEPLYFFTLRYYFAQTAKADRKY